jgi:hypothetical protein
VLTESGQLLSTSTTTNLSSNFNFINNFWEPETYVGSRKAVCLVDSGASTSVISHEFLNNNEIKSLQLTIRDDPRQLMMADGSIQSSIGQVSLPVHINKQRFLINATILHDLSYDLILGREFMSENGLILDFDQHQLVFMRNGANQSHMESSKLVIYTKTLPYTILKVLNSPKQSIL